jgi:hypothetical protein
VAASDGVRVVETPAGAVRSALCREESVHLRGSLVGHLRQVTIHGCDDVPDRFSTGRFFALEEMIPNGEVGLFVGHLKLQRDPGPNRPVLIHFVELMQPDVHEEIPDRGTGGLQHALVFSRRSQGLYQAIPDHRGGWFRPVMQFIDALLVGA